MIAIESVTNIILVDEILIDSRWHCIVRNQCLDVLLVLFHITKVIGKVLLDSNTIYNPIVHRIHGY